MTTSNDDYEAGLDEKPRKALELLRTNPDKPHSVMDIYGIVYTEEEKSAHRESSGGSVEAFREIQRWLDGFREKGHVTSRIISAQVYYLACK